MTTDLKLSCGRPSSLCPYPGAEAPAQVGAQSIEQRVLLTRALLIELHRQTLLGKAAAELGAKRGSVAFGKNDPPLLRHAEDVMPSAVVVADDHVDVRAEQRQPVRRDQVQPRRIVVRHIDAERIQAKLVVLGRDHTIGRAFVARQGVGDRPDVCSTCTRTGRSVHRSSRCDRCPAWPCSARRSPGRRRGPLLSGEDQCAGHDRCSSKLLPRLVSALRGPDLTLCSGASLAPSNRCRQIRCNWARAWDHRRPRSSRMLCKLAAWSGR
jgi:hypothetical protein